jgi:hypothetical protein
MIRANSSPVPTVNSIRLAYSCESGQDVRWLRSKGRRRPCRARRLAPPRSRPWIPDCPASFEAFFFVSDLAIDEVSSGYLPTSPPTPSPPGSTTNEPDDQQQYQRADGGVDDRRNNARAKMDAELRKQPTTDERTNNSNDEIADDPKSGALHDLAG